MVRKVILLCAVAVCLANAQWVDFSTQTASTNLSGAVNGKLNVQTGTGAPSAQNGTAGKDLYVDTATGNVYVCRTTGTPCGAWVLANSATLAAVATSGAYSDLSGKPTLATVATSGAYADLSGKPTNIATATALAANGSNCSAGSFPLGIDASGAAEGCTALATVATSGSYVDLSSKPTNIATATALAANGANCSAGSYPLGVDASGAAEGCTALAAVAASGSYNDLSNKPSIPSVVSSWGRYAVIYGSSTVSVVTVTSSLASNADQNDIEPCSGYTSGGAHTYLVQYDSASTFKWNVDAGGFTTGVAITGSSTCQTLSNGFRVSFGHSSGYTSGDSNTFALATPAATAGALTQDVTVVTPAPKTVLEGLVMYQPSAFAGSSITTLTFSVGRSGTETDFSQPQCLVSGTCGTVLGNSTGYIYADGGASIFNMASQAIVGQFTAVGADLSAMTAGVLDLWIKSSVLP